MQNKHRILALWLTTSLTVTLLAGCANPAGGTAPAHVPAPTKPIATNSGSDLIIEDIIVGTGAEATEGCIAVVHYTGWLVDGTVFDSSYDRGEPFAFDLGLGQVITGWDQGVVGMKVGGKRKLTIPYKLAYGVKGVGNKIPGKATLIFEIELLEVE